MGRNTAMAAATGFVLLLIIGSVGFVYHFSQDRKKPDIALPAPAKPPALTNNQIPLTQDTRNDRKAALALIPPAPSQAAPTLRALPEIRNPAVAVAPSIAPILIQGSGSATPLERALHPSLAPPAGITPSTQPVADTKPGSYENAVNLELARKFVMAMCTDLSGNLWVATEGGGVQRFDPKGEKYKEWTQFTTKDGLGDDFGYAIACDKLGRIWVGHLNHGVSVFNGQKWQNYEVVGGLSKPDSLSGPIGERIFHISVCPTNGDVWMASSAGLARYHELDGKWIYYTRADGLPSDQASSMAFDKDGNIYVATQCDGLAMADAADGYSHWRQVLGPYELVTTPTGEGLPSNLLNDVLVASDGTVYVATDGGLAWSADRGKSWRFVRGADWAEKVRQSAAGPSAYWKETPGAILAEDYCTCLAEDSAGIIYVGYRVQGWQRFQLRSGELIALSQGTGHGYVKALPAGLGRYNAGTYGEGVLAFAPQANTNQATLAPAAPPKLPAGAIPPSVAEQQAAIDKLAAATPKANLVNGYYGEDWMTQGDWLRGYGRLFAVLCGAHSPFDDISMTTGPYNVEGYIGPHMIDIDALRHWVETLTSSDRNALYEPREGARRDAQWDDHGEVYSPVFEGPDIFAEVTIPEGIHRITAYFWNDNGHVDRNMRRDFLVTFSLKGEEHHILSRARVNDFTGGGVHKTFLAKGPGVFLMQVSRNFSLNATCAAVFIDKVTGPPSYYETVSPLAVITRTPYLPPDLNQLDGLSETAMPWFGMEDLQKSLVIPPDDRMLRVNCYRATAADSGAPAKLLENWRWRLHLWNDVDRTEFDKTIAEGWAGFKSLNHMK